MTSRMFPLVACLCALAACHRAPANAPQGAEEAAASSGAPAAPADVEEPPAPAAAPPVAEEVPAPVEPLPTPDEAEAKDRCALPFEVGRCKALMPVFWHNPDNGKCEPRNYGGCGGNENRFDTLEACEAACRGR